MPSPNLKLHPPEEEKKRKLKPIYQESEIGASSCRLHSARGKRKKSNSFKETEKIDLPEPFPQPSSNNGKKGGEKRKFHGQRRGNFPEQGRTKTTQSCCSTGRQSQFSATGRGGEKKKKKRKGEKASAARKEKRNRNQNRFPRWEGTAPASSFTLTSLRWH